VAGGLWGVLAVSGLLSESTVWLAGLGVIVATATALAAVVAHLRMLRWPTDPALAIAASARVTQALALGFLAKLGGLAAGIGALLLMDVKFAGLAAFALAFTGASLVIQLWTAALLNRTSGRPSATPLHRS